MSAYALQQYLFDALRDRGTPIERYDLSEAEQDAVDGNDIAALHVLGVHPVLLNAWCRATGHTRDEYRQLLAPYRRPETRRPRWRS